MKEKSRIFVVIDTNVLVSSLLSASEASNPAKVIKAVLNGLITPLYTNEIIEEYRDVLSRKKFKFDPELIEQFISAFTYGGICSERVQVEDESFTDPDDIVFYEVTLSKDSAFLVTGNIKHFPKKPFVVTPAQMVEILKKEGLIDI